MEALIKYAQQVRDWYREADKLETKEFSEATEKLINADPVRFAKVFACASARQRKQFVRLLDPEETRQEVLQRVRIVQLSNGHCETEDRCK